MVVLLCLAALAIPVLAEGFTLDELMLHLAKREGGTAYFVERKYLKIIDQAMVSSGELKYQASGRLEKKTTSPRLETLVLDGTTLEISRDDKKQTLDLTERPEVRAISDGLLGALSGNRNLLERHFKLKLMGNEKSWRLKLIPREGRITRFISYFLLTGAGLQLRTFEYYQSDGDYSVMSIRTAP